MRTELEIGDKIHVNNVFNNYNVQVIRVTKTMAIAKSMTLKNKFELRFKRKVVWRDTAKLINEGKWNIIEYTILTLDKPKEELKCII